MNTPKTFNHYGLPFIRVIFLTVLLTLVFGSAFAQHVFDSPRNFSKTSSLLSPAAPPNIDQCANGTTPATICQGNNWQNGNLNENNSSYVEGQSVPYRIRFTNLTANSTGNTITIEYDTTENGRHTFDYLTSFNRSETDADPCSGVTGCNLASFSDFPIPTDPNFTSACPACTQIAGNFRLYGGTITAVSAYTLSGTYAGTSQTSITITFDAGPNPDSIVLAWGGHISTRKDWGVANSAVALSGSPYHMRIGGGGAQQDRSLKVDAVIFPAVVTIIKEVTNFNGGTASTTPFNFTATNFGVSGFTLIDNNSQPADRYVNENITAFGATNTITVTETNLPSGWSLSDAPICVEDSGGFTQIDNSTGDLAAKTATIIVEEGEFVTCTFRNVQSSVSAANVSVSGRVTNAFGLGIRRAAVSIYNANTLETKTVFTNSFGYYKFDNLPVNDFYIMNVSGSKKFYDFPTRSFSLSDSLTDINFTAQ